MTPPLSIEPITLDDDEEPSGDEETVGARSEHNEHWLMTPTVS